MCIVDRMENYEGIGIEVIGTNVEAVQVSVPEPGWYVRNIVTGQSSEDQYPTWPECRTAFERGTVTWG